MVRVVGLCNPAHGMNSKGLEFWALDNWIYSLQTVSFLYACNYDANVFFSLLLLALCSLHNQILSFFFNKIIIVIGLI